MTDWLQQYSASLEARDAVEQAHKKYIDAYTRLADKAASERRDRATESQARPASALATPIKGKASGKDGTADITALRADLISSQKARASLATSLKDVELQLAQLQIERKLSSSQIAVLTKSKVDTERKLRDREEELRGKASLVERAQDEMVALELQMSMAEDRAEKLSKENKDLVDRWMKRMGEEADKVNRDSKWQ